MILGTHVYQYSVCWVDDVINCYCILSVFIYCQRGRASPDAAAGPSKTAYCPEDEQCLINVTCLVLTVYPGMLFPMTSLCL